MKVLYTNADQLPNKMDDLLTLIAGDEPNIIMITEVLPKQQKHHISLSLLQIEGYIHYCNFEDRNDSDTGIRGTSIYVKNDIPSQEVKIEDNAHNDHIWVELPLRGNEKLLCGCIYRSPSGDKEENIRSTNEICKLISTASGMMTTHLLIAGDFNLPGIDWENEFTQGERPNLSDFVNTIQNCFLYQHTRKPTRYRAGETSNVLDLVITNEEGMVTNINHCPGIGKSDHECLIFDLRCNKQMLEKETIAYNFFKGNYNKIEENIRRINWDNILSGDVNDSCAKFLSCIDKEVKENIPKRRVSSKKKSIFMTPACFKLRKTKLNLWKYYTRSGKHEDLLAFKKCRDELRSKTRELRENFECLLTKDIKTKSKPFWNYVKSRLKTRTDIPMLNLADGSKAISAREKADALGKFFISVFTDEDTANVPLAENKFYGAPLSTITFTPKMVENKLLQLNDNKSPGPDNIHPVFLKRLANILCVPISIIFNKSIKSRTNPIQWLEALITAIHKKGPKNIPDNYRPISLTSVLSKVMGSLIRDAIMKHMVENNLLANEQHGFVPSRNCMTQLLESLEAWCDIIEDGGCADVIFTDFSKAFDSVPHLRLLNKLESYGITGELLMWIKSFLQKRKQRVKVNGELSDWFTVKSGVPQGTVLGPILFVIYINDMPDVITSSCKIFADDAKVFSMVSQDSTLQTDLDNLVKWSELWQLPFNYGKCKCLHLGKNNQGNSYYMNGKCLSHVENEKDLGVIIDKELKFHKQSAAAVMKANRVLGLIKKTFTTKSEATIPLLYMTLVRPHLEYANTIWGPHYKEDQKMVENVQRRATKMISSIKNLPYEARLRYLNLPSLQHRRKRGDMIRPIKS